MQCSPNAFAISESSGVRPSSVLSEQDGNARATKRPRLSEDAVAAIHTQCADAETSLEVDHMMLDYLAYQAIKACFASRTPNAQEESHISLSKSVTLADAFLSLFKERHPTYTPDPELRLRIQLLRLSTLFTQRFTRNPSTPSINTLNELRRSNRARSRQWIDLAKRKPIAERPASSIWPKPSISNDELERNRANVLHELGLPAEDEQYEDAYYGTMSSISLLDTLPYFMQVSAARNAMSSSNLTERWMHLAGEYMLQACVERLLVFGTTDVADVADEAFAWGYLEDVEPVKPDSHANGCSEEVNGMFEDEEYAMEVEGWKDVKASYLQQLLPSSQIPGIDQNSIIRHLESVAHNHPLATFESALYRFLEAISDSVSEPMLVQLEKGELSGMTEQETKDFLRDCGVGAARFFETPAGFKATTIG